ncbi:MAG: hypothetical protein OEL89_03755 [Candidatus Peregrinibacteria bacterium]|nr:hypothetical protein [Candidatus Peregrinibacteria bacterium]
MPKTDSFVISVIVALTLSVLQLSLSTQNIEKEVGKLEKQLPFNLSNERLSSNNKLRESILNISNRSIEIISSKSFSGNRVCIDNIYINEVYKTVTDCENKLEQINNGMIRVITEETREFWSQMIMNVSSSFFTTNYSMFNGSYGRINSSPLLELQKETINRINGKYERLFIYESEEELKELSELLTAQRDIGIEVKVISREQYNSVARKKNWFQRIGSPDFSIIDNEYLYVSYLDDGNISHIELIRDVVRLKDALTFTGIIRDYTRDI